MTFSPDSDLLYVSYFRWWDAAITFPGEYIWDLRSQEPLEVETDADGYPAPYAMFTAGHMLRFGMEARHRPNHGYRLIRNPDQPLKLAKHDIQHIRKKAPGLVRRYLSLWKQTRDKAWADAQLHDYREMRRTGGDAGGWLDNMNETYIENRILIHRVLKSDRVACPIVEQALTGKIPALAVETGEAPQVTRIEVSANRRLFKIESGETVPIGVPGLIAGNAFAQTDQSGRYLVSGHTDGTIRLWALDTGAQVAHQKICSTEVVAASPVAAKPAETDMQAPDGARPPWPRGLALCEGKRPILVDFKDGTARSVSDFVSHLAARIQTSERGNLALVHNHMSYRTVNLDIAQVIDLAVETPIYRSRWQAKDEWSFQHAVTAASLDGRHAYFAGRSIPLERGKLVDETLSEEKNSEIHLNHGRQVADQVANGPGPDGTSNTTELDAFQLPGSQQLISLTHSLDESQEGYLVLSQVPEFRTVLQVHDDDLFDASVIGAAGSDVVLVGHDDGKISAYSVPALKLIGSQVAHDSPIAGISRSPNRERVVTTSHDGTIFLWRWSSTANRLVKIASMHGLPEGEWLTITPDGFFGGSPPAGSMINVVRNADVSSVSQLFEHLHRPDLLEELLKGDPERKYKDAASKLNLARILESGPAPRLKLLDKKTERAGGTVRISVRLSDQGGGIGSRLVWRVNGIVQGTVTPQELSGDAKTLEGKSVTIAQTLRVDPSSSNRIEVTAYNLAELVTTPPLKITVESFGTTRDERPRMHVLAIGVNRYRMPDYELRHAVNDAKKLSQALQVIGSTLFSGVTVSTLTDEEVTRDNIAAKFNELSAAGHPSDVFVLFLAGHGKSVAGRYYYYPQSIDFSAGHNVEEHGIGQDAWQQWLAKLPMQKTLLIIDTCESGSATSLVRGAFAARRTAMNQLQYATGHNIIAAARAAQPAYEGYKDHGVLTYALLEAFSEDGATRNDKIMLFELAARVGERVPEITRSLFGIAQWTRPKLSGDNFPIGLRQAAAALFGKPGIDKTPTHVVIRAAAVREQPSSLSMQIAELVPGTQVRVIKFAGEDWAVVARDGQQIGYLPAGALARLQ